jgi:hypothetical protein
MQDDSAMDVGKVNDEQLTESIHGLVSSMLSKAAPLTAASYEVCSVLHAIKTILQKRNLGDQSKSEPEKIKRKNPRKRYHSKM